MIGFIFQPVEKIVAYQVPCLVHHLSRMHIAVVWSCPEMAAGSDVKPLLRFPIALAPHAEDHKIVVLTTRENRKNAIHANVYNMMN